MYHITGPGTLHRLEKHPSTVRQPSPHRRAVLPPRPASIPPHLLDPLQNPRPDMRLDQVAPPSSDFEDRCVQRRRPEDVDVVGTTMGQRDDPCGSGAWPVVILSALVQGTGGREGWKGRGK